MEEEQINRVLGCINSCWPEFPFTLQDINGRKPMSGDKFRELLILFLRGFLGSDYQLPGINMAECSKNPEMFAHLEGKFSLFREMNYILKTLGYHHFFPIDLIRPSPAAVRDILLVLVNFLAYFESEEDKKAQVEDEVISLKKDTGRNEKRLVEEERLLGQAKQNAEEQRMKESELRQHLLQRKERYLNVEGSVNKLETDAEELSKRVSAIGVRLEQATANLQQVEIEKEKAAEAVVPDPEALEAELLKSRNDKESLLADYQCLKERLPVLEQQLQDRQNRLQEHKESIQRMNLIKAREAKVKSEWSKAEKEYRLAEEESQTLQSQLRKEASLTESRKRMLEELNGKIAQLQGQLEKTRSDLKQRKSDEELRRAQMESRTLALESQIAQLKKALQDGQKALDEGAVVFLDLQRQHEKNTEQLRIKLETRLGELNNVVNLAFPDIDGVA